jgi:hypothetical protein
MLWSLVPFSSSLSFRPRTIQVCCLVHRCPTLGPCVPSPWPFCLIPVVIPVTTFFLCFGKFFLCSSLPLSLPKKGLRCHATSHQRHRVCRSCLPGAPKNVWLCLLANMLGCLLDCADDPHTCQTHSLDDALAHSQVGHQALTFARLIVCAASECLFLLHLHQL